MTKLHRLGISGSSFVIRASLFLRHSLFLIRHCFRARPLMTTKSASARPEWTPRIWEGIDFFAWVRLLARNRFAVDWSCLYIAIIVTLVSFVHSALRLLQEAWLGSAIRRTRLRYPPIFIVGHWRTGTTLLHELLILDPRHTYPTTYECLEPNHFLVSERILTWLLPFLMPSRSPM